MYKQVINQMNSSSYIRSENYYFMEITILPDSRNKAILVTAGTTFLLLLLLFLLRWEIPRFEQTKDITAIEVELNLPPDPPVPFEDGGGGGGNPVEADGNKGVAPPAAMEPGTPEPSKAIEDDPNSTSPAIAKTVATKPKATKIATSSVTKTKPTVIENPAPPAPKALMGKTTSGTGNGGGAAVNFDKTGGTGTGVGVGNGSGTGGGTGGGIGGGNGTGIGTGNGPHIIRGDRKIVRSYSFEGDLNKATIYANVNVSPDGTGKFISIAKGSSSNSAAYKEAIVKYLQNIRFNASDHESMLTVQFNFRVN